MEYQEFIQQSLEEAAKIARKRFGRVSGTTKEGDKSQVLTETDIEIGKYLIDRIQHSFPQYNIIDEEAGIVDEGSEYTWVIDPIDGTSNFAEGVPTYGVMLGLLEGGQPIAGGIALPSFEEVCIAEKGKGAFCNGERMQVTGTKELDSVLVVYMIDAHREDPDSTRQECALLAEIVLRIRNLRSSSSAFDFVMVAKGKYGAVLMRTSKIWDNVAPQILIEEAEGVYTDFFGKKIDYSNSLSKASQNFTFCAAPPALHRQLQEIIHRDSVSSL